MAAPEEEARQDLFLRLQRSLGNAAEASRGHVGAAAHGLLLGVQEACRNLSSHPLIRRRPRDCQWVQPRAFEGRILCLGSIQLPRLPVPKSIQLPPWGPVVTQWARCHVAAVVTWVALVRALPSALLLRCTEFLRQLSWSFSQGPGHELLLASLSFRQPQARRLAPPAAPILPSKDGEDTSDSSSSSGLEASTERDLDQEWDMVSSHGGGSGGEGSGSRWKTSPSNSGHDDVEMRQAREAGASGGQEGLDEDRDEEDEADRTKVEALYVSSSKHYCPDILTSGFSFKPWTEYWALLNTGEVYLGLPHGDPRHFDFDEERVENPDRFVPLESLGVGSPVRGIHYQGRLVPFDPRRQAIQVSEGVVFHKVGSCNGLRLEGTYLHDAPKDFVETSESFGLHGATSISFNKDGTFFVSGCTNICFRSKAPHGKDYPSSMDNTHGVYSITGNRIEFKYDGGSVEDAYFFEFPNASNNIVSINGVTYRRID